MAKQKETKDTDLSMQLEHFVSSGKIKKAKLKYDVGDRNGCILAAARLASESGEDYYVFATGLRWKATPTSVGTSKNTIKAQGGLRITPQGEVFVIDHPFKSQASTETTALSIPKPKRDWRKYDDPEHWYAYVSVIKEYAAKFGYREIGQGATGFVLYRVADPFFLIKVFADKAYLEYVKLCQTTLKENPYVPVFKGKPIKISKNPVVYAIRIEHLSSMLNTTKYTSVINQTRILFDYLVDTFKASTEDLDSEITKYLTQENFKLSERYRNDKHFKSFVLSLFELLRRNKTLSLDMWLSNAMLRREQIVFIDPICNSNSMFG